MSNDDNWKSIGDLCKPLSAKVMPKGVSRSRYGQEYDDKRLIHFQRLTRASAARRGVKKAGK